MLQYSELPQVSTPWSSVGYLVYKRTYSRTMENTEATEELPNSVLRVVNAADKQLNVGFTKAEEIRLASYLLQLKGSVAGRFWWQLGTETVNRFGLLSLQNCAFTVIDHPIRPFCWAMDALALGSGVGYSIQRKHVDKLPEVQEWFKAPTRFDDGGADFIVPDSREGWVKLLGKTLKAAMLSDSEEKGTFTFSTQIIRGKGTPIKGFGGVASGPEDLCWGIQKISEVLMARRGKKLRPIDCLDIMNIIGAIIVAGNVRRSAQIAIGDPDDIEFLLAKRWDNGGIPSWRAMSNNSVACDDIEDLHPLFWETYEPDPHGHAREPYGLINLRLSRRVGRLGETQYTDPLVEGYNPCGEQSLEPYETCCLSEIFLPNIESKEELFDVATLLYRINKHSLMLPCHHPETDAVVFKNMRMGIGMTGILQASEEQLSWLDDCYMYLRAYDDEYSEANGMNPSIKLTTVKPSGCSVKETLLTTSEGFLRLEEIGDIRGEEWQDINLDIYQEHSVHNATKFYVNGFKETIVVKTDGGFSLESTPNHQYRVLTAEGNYVWKRMDEIDLGDKIPYKVGGYEGGKLSKLYQAALGPRSAFIDQPEYLNENIAYFLGAYFADGSNHTKGIRIAGNTTTKKTHIEKLFKIVEDEFKLSPKLYERADSINQDLYITSQGMLNWLAINELIKQKSDLISIPKYIRTAPRNILEAFIDGFFAGDGHLNRDTRVFTTTSLRFAEELVTIMRALGIDSKFREMPPTKSSWGEKMRYWISERKGRKADNRYIAKDTKEVWQHLDNLGMDSFSYDTVIAIEHSNNETFDIEVPVNNCYTANSYISHNTLSLLPGVTPGIHPAYSQYMYRRIRMASEHQLVEVCRKNGYPIEFQKKFDGSEDKGTVVVTFPFSYPSGTILAKDMTALQQLSWIKRLQEIWSDNSVSCTIYYKMEELPEIKEYLKKYYRNNHKSLSFLLHSEHGFKQAPLEEITKEQFRELNNRVTLISNLHSAEFESVEECAGGACPVR